MDVIDRLVASAKARRRTVVLPECTDERIVLAARRLLDERIARPVLVGRPAQTAEVARAAGINLDGLVVVDPAKSADLNRYSELYRRSRGRGSPGTIRRLLSRPLYYGAMMVKAGDAHALVSGVASPTHRVIEAGMLAVGLAEGIATPSSFFLMLVPNFRGRDQTPLIFADCAVNIEPDSQQLAAIALASADTARHLLDEEPRVAMLSFSTHGSARHLAVDRVRDALDIIRQKAPDLAADGELQADAALVSAVAANKVAADSPVAGRANVLIFPDLNAGNIGYKLVQHLGGAMAIGPVLQGFAKPVADLSRGADVDDIIATICIVLAQG